MGAARAHPMPGPFAFLLVALSLASGASGATYSDAFDRGSLGPQWSVDRASFSIDHEQLAADVGVRFQNAQLRWLGGLTDTPDQSGKLHVVDPGVQSLGFMLRVNGTPGAHYEVHFSDVRGSWRWERYDPDFLERLGECTGDGFLAGGDWIGAAIEGSGPSTVVSVWRWAADPDAGGPVDVDANWGPPDCTLSTSSGGFVDGGRALGIRAYTGSSTGVALMDDWTAGDLGSDAPPPGCTANSQCDDGDPCTDDACSAGSCTHVPNTLPCDDGDACTTGDACSGGVCVGGTPPACDDGNPCTDDFCDPVSGCGSVANTAACNDGDACTTGDACSGGVCVGGAPPACDDGNPCTDDFCDPGSGCGSVANTAACDDGDACTTGDACSAGTCLGGVPVDCDDGDPCTTESCGTSGACEYEPVVCPPGQSCDATSGLCESPPVPGQSFADDFDRPALGSQWAVDSPSFSVVADQLVADVGIRFRNAQARWLGGSTDTVDQYEKIQAIDAGVQSVGFLLRVNGTPGTHYEVQVSDVRGSWRWERYDGNFTGRLGECVGDGFLSQGDWIGATVEGFGAATRVSVWRWDADPDAGDPVDVSANWGPPDCTMAASSGGFVDSGTSLGVRAYTGPSKNDAWLDNWAGGDVTAQPPGGCGADADCGDGNPCTDDRCDAGACVHDANADPCDDGNTCTTGDACSGGTCIGGAPPDCSDGNPCTDDACNPASGCTSLPNTAACDDGNACTTGDACSAGSCVGGPPPDCDDANPCTDDACDSVLGCVGTPNASSCSDGLFCNGAETCGGGACLAGSDPCARSCDEASDACVGCIADGDCDDGDPCTVDSCGAGGSCVSVPVLCPAGESCDAVTGLCGPVAGEGGMVFADDFDRASLGPSWTVDGGSFSIDANRLVEDSGVKFQNAQLRWLAGETETLDQYGKIRVLDLGTHSFGFLFRVNGSPGLHYEVHLPAGDVRWRWERYDPGFLERLGDCAGDTPLANGDWIGASVEGTGPATIVSVWRWDADPDAGDPVDVSANWGPPDCTMAASSGGFVDGGRSLGIRAYTGSSSLPGFADDWFAGDLGGDGAPTVPTVELLLDSTGAGLPGLRMIDPNGVTSDAAGNVYVAACGVDDASEGVFRVASDGSVSQLLGSALDDGVSCPTGIAVQEGSGSVFVAGYFSDNVVEIAPDGSLTEVIGPNGDGVEPLRGPLGLALDSGGGLLVAGSASHNVFRVGSTGGIQRVADASGDGTAPLFTPFGIAIDAFDRAYVTALDSSNVFRIDPDGTVEEVWGPGSGGPALAGPQGIAVDAAGNLYVAAHNLDRVYRIDPGGVAGVVLDASGDGAGNPLDGPTGIAVDGAQRVYVAGFGSNNVFQVSPSGSITQILDAAGDGVAAFQRPTRLSLATTADGRVIAAGTGSNNVFAVSPPSPPGATPFGFFDHFDGSELSVERWHVETTAGATAAPSGDSYLTLDSPAAGEATLVRPPLPLDLTRSQTWMFALRLRSDGPFEDVVALWGLPVGTQPGVAGAAALDTQRLASISFASGSGGDSVQFRHEPNRDGLGSHWAGTPLEQWTQPGTEAEAISPVRTGAGADWYVVGLQLDAASAALRLFGLHRETASLGDPEQGPKLTALSDWIDLATLEGTGALENVWLTIGDRATDATAGTLDVEWIRFEAAPSRSAWTNVRESATSAYELRRLIGNGTRFLPEARGGDPLGPSSAWDAGGRRKKHVVRGTDGTHYLFYEGFDASGQSALGVATASTPEGPWIQAPGNPIITADVLPGGIATYDVVTAPWAIRDLDETDSQRLWKLLMCGEVRNSSTHRMFLLRAPAPTGPWTLEPGPGLEGAVLDETSGPLWRSEGACDPLVWWNGTDQAWNMLFSGIRAGFGWSVGFASSPDLIAWTESLANPVLTADLDQVQGWTTVDGASVEVPDGSRFARDSIVVLRNAFTSDDLGLSRIRKIAGNTLELYHEIGGLSAADSNRSIAALAAGSITPAALVREPDGSYRLYVTAFQPFIRADGPFGNRELAASLTGTTPQGPWTWDHAASPSVPPDIWGAGRAQENLAIVNLPVER